MFSTYVNLGPRKKVRIHRSDCKEVRKNGVEMKSTFGLMTQRLMRQLRPLKNLPQHITCHPGQLIGIVAESMD